MYNRSLLLFKPRSDRSSDRGEPSHRKLIQLALSRASVGPAFRPGYSWRFGIRPRASTMPRSDGSSHRGARISRCTRIDHANFGPRSDGPSDRGYFWQNDTGRLLPVTTWSDRSSDRGEPVQRRFHPAHNKAPVGRPVRPGASTNINCYNRFKE